MKRFSIITVLILLFLEANAQELNESYHTIITKEIVGHAPLLPTKFPNYKEWYIYLNNLEFKHKTIYTWCIDDSIIDDKCYSIVISTLTDSAMLYRQEDNKVYRLNKQSKEEELILDYNLAIGDMIRTSKGRVLQVIEKDPNTDITSYFNSSYSGRILKLVDTNDSNYYDYWIEGCGSLRYGILTENDLGKDAQLVYSQDDFYDYFFSVKTPDYLASPISLPSLKPEELVELYNNYSTLTIQDSITATLTEDSLIIQGIINTKTGNYYYELKKNNSELYGQLLFIERVDGPESPSYKKLYLKLYPFTLSSYTLHFMAFNEIDLTNQQGSSIISHNKDLFIPQDFFDLNGRRLNSVPEKGMYIKNGRKWLRK